MTLLMLKKRMSNKKLQLLLKNATVEIDQSKLYNY